MRDLANQNFTPQSAPISGKIAIPQSVVRIVLILIVTLVILVVARQLLNSGGFVGRSSLTLKDAPKGLTPVAIGTSANIEGEDALNLAIESASFVNVSGVSGSATATRKYGDGSFTMSVNATLPIPEGDTYQVWIVGGDILKLAGTMDGSENYSLVFNDVDNYSSTNTIWITREITPNEGRPEKHVLEGTF